MTTNGNHDHEEPEVELTDEPAEVKPRRPHKYESLRHAVRFFYDAQKLRIQSGNRNAKREDGSGADLDEDDKEFLTRTSTGLNDLEKITLKEIKRLLKPIPIYQWLSEQKGLGPTMAGVIVSELETSARFETVSNLWSYSGLGVDTATGKARRRKKGEKANWNSFLKTKLLGVLGPCMIKANSPWRKLYDNYKHRKQAQGWGVSDGHRHNAAVRYMCKMLLLELWKTWRELDGLPVTAPYSEAKLGLYHGEHGKIVLETARSEELQEDLPGNI
jgi:hypothetical protein